MFFFWLVSMLTSLIMRPICATRWSVRPDFDDKEEWTATNPVRLGSNARGSVNRDGRQHKHERDHRNVLRTARYELDPVVDSSWDVPQYWR